MNLITATFSIALIQMLIIVAYNHISNEIGLIKINKITPMILQDYFHFLKKQEHFNCNSNSGTVKVIKNILNNVFKLALNQNIIKINPMTQVEFKNKKQTLKKELKVIPRNELIKIEEAIKGTRYFIPYIIALHTGARRGEILGLTWEDIDFENNRMNINKALQYQKGVGLVLVGTKTKSSVRNFKMTSRLIQELKLHYLEFQATKDYYGICITKSKTLFVAIKMVHLFIQHDFQHSLLIYLKG